MTTRAEKISRALSITLAPGMNEPPRRVRKHKYCYKHHRAKLNFGGKITCMDCRREKIARRRQRTAIAELTRPSRAVETMRKVKRQLEEFSR